MNESGARAPIDARIVPQNGTNETSTSLHSLLYAASPCHHTAITRSDVPALNGVLATTQKRQPLPSRPVGSELQTISQYSYTKALCTVHLHTVTCAADSAPGLPPQQHTRAGTATFPIVPYSHHTRLARRACPL